mgnify:CR=1 FL=1
MDHLVPTITLPSILGFCVFGNISEEYHWSKLIISIQEH